MRVNHVKKARKDQGNCQSCGEPIVAGQAYKYIEFRYGGARKRHATCPDFRPSEMTQSKMSGVYAAQEGFEDDSKNFATPADIAGALGAAAEQVRSVSEEYAESAQNMEDGFGHETYQSEEMRETGESLEQWASDIEDAASEVEGMDELCSECHETEEGGDYDHHEFIGVVDHPVVCSVDGCHLDEDTHHEFELDLDEARQRAEDTMMEVPV